MALDLSAHIAEDAIVNSAIEYYKQESVQFPLKQLLNQVTTFFELNPNLQQMPLPHVHSIKARIKDPEHLRDKLHRKFKDGTVITSENLLDEINDLVGVRVLHIYHEQFKLIHDEIVKKTEIGDWVFGEEVKAYTWDPETQAFFAELKIDTSVRDTYYTSVHYIIKPNSKSPYCCEIQVRTLFEEIWGEIDHAINYPHKTKSVACSEQLRVLSKLVSTGTRLSDSIFRSYGEHRNRQV